MDNPWPFHTHFSVFAGTIAVAASALLGGYTLAGSTSNPCQSAGHPSTPTEITARSARDLRTLEGQRSWMGAERLAATPGSPADFRLADEATQIQVELRQLVDLRDLAAVSSGATTGSPAQARTDNELIDLCATQVAHPSDRAVR
jgi:hypothetical protein